MTDTSKLNLPALAGNKHLGARNYWKKRLEGLEFKSYFAGGASGREERGEGCVSSVAPSALYQTFHKIAGSAKAKHLVLLSALGVMTEKYAGSKDICVFTAAQEGGIVPFRMTDFCNGTFKRLLMTVRDEFVQDARQSAYPVKMILETQRVEVGRVSFMGMVLEDLCAADALAPLMPEIVFSFSCAGEELRLNVLYNRERQGTEYVALLPGLFWHLLGLLISRAEEPIISLALVSDEEKVRILQEFNCVGVDVAGDETILSLFDKMVHEAPGNRAVQYRDRVFTYLELRDEADRIARYLRGVLKVQPGDLVGVMFRRDEWLIPVILGILKAGAAYIPLDPGYPGEWIESIIEDSNMRVVVTRGVYLTMGLPGGIEVFDIDLPFSGGDTGGLEAGGVPAGSLAYVIYTSGSTGKPKGVMVEHGSLLNIVTAMHASYPVVPGDRYLMKTSFSFDVSVMEIFGWIPGGGSVVLADPGAEADPEMLLNAIRDGGITHVNFVPTMFSAFVDRLAMGGVSKIDSLKYIFLAGEALPKDLVHRFGLLHLPVRLENLYGPTEGTVYSSQYSIADAGEGLLVPIGRPIANVRLYIVNTEMQLQPIGAPGELCISGAGLARGYLNNEVLTAEKFVDNPFEPGQRMYKAGDLVRWMPDGNILFLDRIDHQVKINGFRIELWQIEIQLADHAGVNGVTVVAREHEGEKFLVAYYLAEKEIEVEVLKLFLAAKLPGYMVPSFYVWMERFPVSVTGKLDRSRLPAPEIRSMGGYVAPANDMERWLAGVWSEILKIGAEGIGVNHSWFELGGNSLRAMTLVNKIQGDLKMDVSIRDVFERKTIGGLAGVLTAAKRSDYSPLKKAETREYYELTISQLRMYYLCEVDRTSLTYNIPLIVRIRGAFDVTRVDYALNLLIARHEALRTYFRIIDHRPVQLVAKKIEAKMEYFKAGEEEVDSVIKAFIRPFALEQAPLMRVGVVEVAPDDFFFVVDIHHIVADGTSVGLLVSDFTELYNDVSLPRIELDYKDYSTWQQSGAYKRQIARQKDFWVKEFSEPLKPLDIPIDYNRQYSTRGNTIFFELSVEETRQLDALATEKAVTISMIILSALSILLNKLSGQEDISIGMAMAGREQIELERMIGMFPLVLPLRTRPENKMVYGEFLTHLKHTLLATFDNQSYQYEDLTRELNFERSTSRNPWYDVLFLFQNFELSQLVMKDLQVEPYKDLNIVAHEKLNLTVRQVGQQLTFQLIYATSLFKEETAENLARYFSNILRWILRTQDTVISDIPLVSAEERDLLLRGDVVRKNIARDRTFSDLFREQVIACADRTAVEHNGDSLTYAELLRDAVKLGSRLLELGVKKGVPVALFLPRGIGMLTSILGVFECGAAYVPMDTDLPDQRVGEIVRDSGAEIVITSLRDAEVVRGLGVEVVIIEEIGESGSRDVIDVTRSADDLAYIIYTSGTTGKPKGVMVHHLGMINHLEAFIDVMGLDGNDVVAQTASAGFDISVWQFLAALAVGGKTVVIDTAVVLDPVEFLRSLDEGGVTVFQSVPSLLTAFLHDLPEGYDSFLKKVRWLSMTGEALGVGLVGEWYARYPAIKMLNVYGPTEASDDITTYVVEPPEDGQQSIPIGRPIQNMQIYILDEQLRVCPEGVKGEICVAGIGVGKGYWRDEEKTKKVFIPNTVSVEPIDPDYRTIYKTGDLGYYQPDGNIVCLGRKDDQVKIRGFRIEPGEIEARLMMHEAVKGAVVLAMEKRGQKYLVAYFIGDGDVKYSELRNFLSAGLPEYMIPAFFVRMESFPVTSNGKLDKKALPMPEVQDDSFVAPSGVVEQAIVELWAELLGIKKQEISVTRNFFELGGNSLLILKLRSILNKTQGWNLSISDLFRYPTISSLVESMAQAADSRVEYDKVAREEVEEMEAFINVLE